MVNANKKVNMFFFILCAFFLSNSILNGAKEIANDTNPLNLVLVIDEQPDRIMMQSVKNALKQNRILMVSTPIMSELNDSHISMLENKSKWSIYKDTKKYFILCIPSNETRSLDQLGFDVKMWDYIAINDIQTTLKNPENIPLKIDDAWLKNFEALFIENSPCVKQIYLTGHGYNMPKEVLIAGIPKKIYHDLLKILASRNTRFLWIATCFAGGINLLVSQKAIAKITAQKKPMFVIVIESVGDVSEVAANTNFSFFEKLTDFYKQPNPPMYLGQPIKTLREPDKSTTSLPKKPYREHVPAKKIPPKIHFSDVIKSMYDKVNFTLENLPTIYIPGAEFFRAVDLDNLFIITSLALKRTRFQNIGKEKIEKQIDPETRAILVYPSNLNDITFLINSRIFPAWISKIGGDSNQFIGGIDAPKSTLLEILTGFLPQQFFEHTEINSQKAWFVKNVKCLNDGKISLSKKSPLTLDGTVIFNKRHKIFKKISETESYLIANEPIAIVACCTEEHYYVAAIPLPLEKSNFEWTPLTKEEFFKLIKAISIKIKTADLSKKTKTTAAALQEATAGMETVEDYKKSLKNFLASCKIKGTESELDIQDWEADAAINEIINKNSIMKLHNSLFDFDETKEGEFDQTIINCLKQGKISLVTNMIIRVTTYYAEAAYKACDVFFQNANREQCLTLCKEVLRGGYSTPSAHIFRMYYEKNPTSLKLEDLKNIVISLLTNYKNITKSNLEREHLQHIFADFMPDFFKLLSEANDENYSEFVNKITDLKKDLDFE